MHVDGHFFAVTLAVSLLVPTFATDTDPRWHWAFQPVKKPAVTIVQNQAWVKTPVDAFVLRVLEGRNWIPATLASKSALIRRVYFDLTGLPPAPEAVERFLKNDASSAYEQI